MPFEYDKTTNNRYYFNNKSFGYTDAIILYSFIRHFRPKKILEIGAGFTSALMMDIVEISNINPDYAMQRKLAL